MRSSLGGRKDGLCPSNSRWIIWLIERGGEVGEGNRAGGKRP